MKDLISMEDWADVLSALEEMPVDNKEAQPMTEEELASMKRYEEIIKKHKN